MAVQHACVGAAVLTGGLSRRMGSDKALLTLGGTTLLRRTLDVLTSVVSDVYIVGDRPEYHAYGVPVIPDAFPSTGPLGGIATALQSTSHPRLLVAACDMPFLSAALLRAMLAIDSAHDVVLPVTIDETRAGSARRRHPLLAIYARRCLPHLLTRIERGRLKVTDALEGLSILGLPEAWLGQHDPTLASLMNVNAPQDLERARQMVAQE